MEDNKILIESEIVFDGENVLRDASVVIQGDRYYFWVIIRVMFENNHLKAVYGYWLAVCENRISTADNQSG